MYHVFLLGSAFYNSDGYVVFLHFPNMMVIDHEQYVIYDFVSIVSAVGGGLGLFLGFSCFSIASRLSKVMKTRLPTDDGRNGKEDDEEREGFQAA